jgi:hypothetical protein
MPNKKIAVPPDIYRIKVTLLDTHPPIWRRLLVPASLTLGQLHVVLQVAMGWDGSHPHEFRIGQQRFGEPDPMEGFTGWPEVAAENMAPLFNVLGGAGAKAVYTVSVRGTTCLTGAADGAIAAPPPKPWV